MPTVPLPTVRLIDPPDPLVETPLPKVKGPVLPDDDVPELRLREPLRPPSAD